MSELITYKLSLNTEYKGCEKQINLIQGESEARAIDVTLTNGSGRIILDSVTDIAIVRGIRSDGKITYNSAKVNSNGNAEYVFTQQDCAKSGTGYYELQILRLKDSNNTDLIKVMYSAQFKIKVDETLYNDEQITSVNEYTELITALAEVKVLQNSLDETIEEAQASLDEAVRSAQNSLKEAIEDAQSSVNDVIYIEDGANIQWTAQSESMAVSSVIESDRVRLLNDGGTLTGLPICVTWRKHKIL